FGSEVVATCLQIAKAAGQDVSHAAAVPRRASPAGVQPGVLVLGGTGFIGQALVRRLVGDGRGVRLLVRDPVNWPRSLQPLSLDVRGGDIANAEDMDKALEGIQHVFHLARAQAKTWDDYCRLEIAATRTVGEACLRRGVRRLIYTGTIDSYYSGD